MPMSQSRSGVSGKYLSAGDGEVGKSGRWNEDWRDIFTQLQGRQQGEGEQWVS